MKLRYIAIALAFAFLYIGLTAYIGWNGWLLLSALTGWEHSGVYTALIIVLASAYLIGRVGQSSVLRPIAELLKLIGSYWFAIFEYGVLILPFANIIAFILKKAGAAENIYIIGVGGAAALLLLALTLRGSWNAWSPVIRSYQVQIAKKAGSITKLRIAAASDIHLGTVIGRRHIERLVRKVEQIQPNIILLPGDILDDDIEPFLYKNMAAHLGKLRAPLGVYAVTGNHEYIGRKVPEFAAALDAIGIRVLMDETALIDESFYIIGRKDKASEGFDQQARSTISQLLAPLDHSLPLIMMDHQPSDMTNAAKHGVDLILSGHTHRGQMSPNHLITRRLFELDWGYLQKESLHAIVSSGFGFWGPPIRIGSRSEVLQIDVEFVDQS